MPRILYVADGRSPTALNWIRYFVERGYEVHLASTFDCAPAIQFTSLSMIRVAFSGLKKQKVAGVEGRSSEKGAINRMGVGLRTTLRQWFGPLTLPYAARRLSRLAARLQPDLIHAMRIPYEGMLAGLAQKSYRQAPLLVSVWGNDFTLHAVSTPLMAYYTRQALSAAQALHTDCQRDMDLAVRWGFQAGKPAVVLPGGGGIQLDVFYPPPDGAQANCGNIREDAEQAMTVINPRGWRAYVRNDTFFRAIPIVLQRVPYARFICPGMEGQTQARHWVEALGIVAAVDLLPQVSRDQMGVLFRQAQVAVSPSTHDGTPNTLLEAMACGCFPIAGDIPSLREWITPGLNGFLVDPGDPGVLADAILAAFENPTLRKNARDHNTRLVAERAEYGRVMRSAEKFYQSMLV